MKLLSFEQFINEGIGRSESYDPKFSQAADLVGKYINKKTNKKYLKFPFVVTHIIDGKEQSGIMFYTDKDNSAIRVGMPTDPRTPGLIGSLQYFSDFASDTADYEITSEQFPIIKLIGEFIQLIKNPKDIIKALKESYILEKKESYHFTEEELKQIRAQLEEGRPVTKISREMDIPYRDILNIRNNVKTKEKKGKVEVDNEMTLDDKVKFLEETMEDIYQITRRVAAGAFNSLFISGRAGTGKTHNVEQGLHDEGFIDNEDYVKVSGAVSVIMLYKMLYQYRTKTLLFDDCDAVFRDENGRNILKAALDTKKVRKLSYLKKTSFVYDPHDFDDNPEGEFNALESGMVPSYFDFEGRVIFISNLEKDKADPDGAIRSRSILIDVNPDDATLMERMKKLLPHLEPKEMPLNEKQYIFEFMQSANDVSMRTFVKAAGFKMAGLSNWKRMANRYL